MPKIQTTCPNCNQPLVADINQVVDVSENPRLKELLLAGGLNFVQCPTCGFQGQLPVPLVYHDKDKELLLTFTPPDAGKTIEEKESALAPLLKKITDSLAPEERKGYLFQPQAMLTMNSLVKNVLMADGITEEMIDKQQEQIKLLDLLFTQEGEALKKTIIDNKEDIDREFFALFAEIAQRVIASQDNKSIEKIQAIQDVLMDETEIGRQIKTEAEEIRAATKSLEALGKNLTRSSLLELVINAPSRERVKALGNLVGQAMDYEFFQQFTERIEKADQDERKELVERRNLLLKISEEIRKELEERLAKARENINKILESDSVEEGLKENIGVVDQLFVDALSVEINEAEKSGDKERTEKINELMQILQRMTAPPELQVVEGLLENVDDQDALNKALNEIDQETMPKVIDYLTSIVGSYEQQLASGEDDKKEQIQQTLDGLKKVFNVVLRKSMESKLNS